MIGWENNQGAYFIQKLSENIENIERDVSNVESEIGKMSDLTTTAKDTLVKAVNEVDSHADTNASNIGTLNSLNTSAKTDLVSSINEAYNITLRKTTVSGTTSSSGALQLPFSLTDFSIVSARCTSATNIFAFPRGSDPYLTVFKLVDGAMTALASTEVTFEVLFGKAKTVEFN